MRTLVVVGALALAGCATVSPAIPIRGTVVATVPLGAGHPHYVGNRAPLMPTPLLKLPIGSIQPRGWLRHQLELMADGMVGHLDEISQWCDFDKSAWTHADGRGEFGWEEVPYWLKGTVDLAFVLKDPRLMAKTRRWLDAVLQNQDTDGFFGPRANRDQRDVWPNMPMMNALQSLADATGDPRVEPFLRRYFRWQLDLPTDQLLPDSWGKVRAGDNLDSVYWLYNRTGEPWLLELAKKIHARTLRWDQGVASWHGVNICQSFREPAVAWEQSHDPRDLAATERDYQDVMARYGQVPGGMFGADENAREGYGDPRQGAETCSMVELMHSDEMLFGLSGDPIYADRAEDVAFNSLPAAVMPDWKGLHYLTAPNMVQLDRASKAPELQNGGDMLGYDPHRYRCCQHNVAHGWPYFAENLFAATQDGGLAAMLYAPSEVTATVGPGRGRAVTLREDTRYPFGDTITLAVDAAQPVEFPLYLRIPGWAEHATVAVNGQPVEVQPRPHSFVQLARVWRRGDTVTLTLPQRVRLRHWAANHDAVSVDYGALTFSLKIGERWATYGGTDAWPAREVFPTTPWNYGLLLDGAAPEQAFTVVTKPGPIAPQPFTPETAPIELKVKARRIPDWKLDEWGLVGLLQPSPARSTEPTEEVTLIPMGAARLRIAAFPTVSDAASAHAWQEPFVRHRASHYSDYDVDSPRALSDGQLPTSSADDKPPRFTWRDQRGTSEWVTYELEAPARVSAVELYWVGDEKTGGVCRPPAAFSLYARQGNVWLKVATGTSAALALDRANRVEFPAVDTNGLKLEVELQPGFSAGLFEWRVDGQPSGGATPAP